MILITLITPLRYSSDQISRLIKTMTSPFRRRLKDGAILLPIVMVIFIACFYLLYRVCGVVGWADPYPSIAVKSLFASLILPVDLIGVMIIVIIIRAVLSWFPISGRGRETVSWLNTFTYPVLAPFRKLNLNLGAFDLTPIVAIFALYVVREILYLILGSLYQSF